MAQSRRAGRRGRERGAGGHGRQQIEGIHPVREALRAGRREIHELRIRTDRRGGDIETLRALAEGRGVPVRDLATLEGGPGNDQGVQLEVSPLPEVPLEALVERGEAPRTLVALDGVEDPRNLGAIVRAADGAGVTGLILTARRAPPLGPVVARASAGAIEWLPVARVPNLGRTLEFLQGEGYWLFGAQLEDATDLYEVPDRWLQGDRVLVLGAEGKGLRSGVSARLDHRVKIPMRGAVDSLNVGSAAAVILYELGRRTRLAAQG